ELAAVYVDVVLLVRDLVRGVELALRPRHGVDARRGREQRALLAVEELREQPAVEVVVERAPPREVEALRQAENHVGDIQLLLREALRIDVDRPIDVGRRVPLQRLPLFIEAEQLLVADVVVPREDRRERARDALLGAARRKLDVVVAVAGARKGEEDRKSTRL